MTEIAEAPPISGPNLPVKELKPKPTPKKGKRNLLVLLILVSLFFALGIGLGFYFQNKKQATPETSPLPEVAKEPEMEASPVASPSPKGLMGKVEGFEKRLDEVDLREQKLSPPVLDFDIRFEAN